MLIRIMLFLSSMDLFLTYYYICRYKKWQPNKPYKKMEGNPLLCFLFNKFGHHIGWLIGVMIILFGVYFITIKTHIIIVGILFVLLVMAIIKTIKNIKKLNELIIKYPNGGKK